MHKKNSFNVQLICMAKKSFMIEVIAWIPRKFNKRIFTLKYIYFDLKRVLEICDSEKNSRYCDKLLALEFKTPKDI